MDHQLMDRLSFKTWSERLEEEPEVKLDLMGLLPFDRLTPEHGKLVQDYYVEGKHQTEIAKEWNCLQSTISIALKKATKILMYYLNAPSEPDDFYKHVAEYEVKRPKMKMHRSEIFVKEYIDTLCQTQTAVRLGTTQPVVRPVLERVARHLRIHYPEDYEYFSYFYPAPPGIKTQRGHTPKLCKSRIAYTPYMRDNRWNKREGRTYPAKALKA